MNSTSVCPAVLEPLHRLRTRIRWKRWLRKLHRFAWLLAVVFLCLFLADALFGMRTLSLRIASAVVLLGACVLFAADWVAAWLVRIDMLGLAHLLEKRYPDLAERLVTLVQLPAGAADTRFVQLLQAETEQRLASVESAPACPLRGEQHTWLRTGLLLVVTFAALTLAPPFAGFSQRFFTAWLTPLVPFEIRLAHGNGYALRGHSYMIEAVIHRLDVNAEMPTACRVICDDGLGGEVSVPMASQSNGHFVAVLDNLRQPLQCRVQAGEAASESFEVRLLDAPAFTSKPTMKINPPSYLKWNPRLISFEDPITAWQFSRLHVQFSLDQAPQCGWLCLQARSDADKKWVDAMRIPVQWDKDGSFGTAELVADVVGEFQAELVLDLEHELTTSLPIGSWTIRADGVPRFTQPLRFHGGDANLRAHQEYQVSPADALKLHTEVEDDEGLGAIHFEFRINDGPSQLQKWLHGAGKKALVIDDWLPLPASLKEKDRVQFRIHAFDNRRLQKGDIERSATAVLPAEDLTPQVVIAPAGTEAWIELRVNASIEGFLKQQAETQAEEIRDVIARIKKKLVNESEQMQKVQRAIHQQPALTMAQIKQAEKLQALNREIAEDLLEAGQRFGANPELARLADHFLDIRAGEMLKSAEALERFVEKDRPLVEAEKELRTAQDALLQARKRLDRMLDWNTLLAQDRLDQWQIEKLAKRQGELSQRLEKLLANDAGSDAEMAKQIDAIRQEQAKLADQTEKLQGQSQLVKESLAALEQKRIERLAKAAEHLATDQRAMREPAADVKDRVDKLKDDLAELAQNGKDPAAKAMAKETAQDLDMAKKSLDASQALKATGDVEQAKKMADAATKQLDLVVKKLTELAQADETKKMLPANAEKTAEALKESSALMRQAEAKLPNMPKDAQAAMKIAAQKLAQATKEANRQSSSKMPLVARNPAAKAFPSFKGGFPGSLPKGMVPESYLGKSWGELPGELKTQMLQDFRARFGDEHAELIREYFERLAETPARKE